MITQTQLESFIEMQTSGRVGANQRIILDLLEQYPQGLTNNEISRILNWSINRITPRINELEKKGRTFRARIKVDVYTHKRNIVWVACVFKQLYKDNGYVEEKVEAKILPKASIPKQFSSTYNNQITNKEA